MVTVEELRAAARKRYDRDHRTWAGHGDADALLELALHPPTESIALRDSAAAIAWVASWRGIAGVDWETRRWASLGSQDVPVRVSVRGAEALARLAGTARAWAVLRARAAVLRSRWPDLVAEPIRREGRTLLALDDADFERLVLVLAWVERHPLSGRYVRQLPIRGVDTKWIERHRALVRGFTAAITGSETLGLAENPALIRLRILDPALRPAGLADLAAPAEQLAALALTPRRVYVFENLESVLALPEIEGAVAVHGSGYAVGRLRAIPWLRDARIRYWGDLDSNGFAILNLIRSACADVTSVLMDERTLADHLDLAGHEATPNRGDFPRLTAEEQSVLARLRRDGDLRLEQERIDWGYALERL
jgi:hypothetical protein